MRRPGLLGGTPGPSWSQTPRRRKRPSSLLWPGLRLAGGDVGAAESHRLVVLGADEPAVVGVGGDAAVAGLAFLDGLGDGPAVQAEDGVDAVVDLAQAAPRVLVPGGVTGDALGVDVRPQPVQVRQQRDDCG